MKIKPLSILARCLFYLLLIGITIPATIAVYNIVTFSKAFSFLATEWNDSIGTKISSLTYAEGQYNNYDLYLPSDTSANSLILFIHGGSFTSGDKADEDAWCKYFAAKGYITATTNYTLAKKNSMTNMNLMYDEMLQCVAAIKAECENRGYHPTQMATSGQSAGGYLAMLYAYRAKDASPLPVKFVFQQTGPATMAPEDWNCAKPDDMARFATVTTGHDITATMVNSGEYRKLVEQISPAYLVDNDTPPTISAYGPRDKVVPVALKYKLLSRLDSVGARNEYIEFPNSGHAMIGDPDKSQLFLDKTLEFCKTYFTK